MRLNNTVTSYDSESSSCISPQARHHKDVHRIVIQHHPEVRTLAGAEYRTALAAPILLCIHWSMAWLVSQTNLLVVFLMAFFVGQIVIHATGALVHETAHKLVFRERLPKLLFDLNLELILGSFGRQLTYQHEHISSHHLYMGDYERDYEHEDICGYLARQNFRAAHSKSQRFVTLAILFVHLLPFGFLIADEIFPRFYRLATGRVVKDQHRDIKATQPSALDRWIFIAVSLGVNVALFLLFGFLGWLYHNWSLSLFLGKCGVTNLGQSLSEHDGVSIEQPTKSTYWWGNLLLFNTGYHNEHHTFPNVAWNRLPKLKELAPEYFNAESVRSYFQLWWDHVRQDFSPSRRNYLMTQDNMDRCPAVAAIK